MDGLSTTCPTSTHNEQSQLYENKSHLKPALIIITLIIISPDARRGDSLILGRHLPLPQVRHLSLAHSAVTKQNSEFMNNTQFFLVILLTFFWCPTLGMGGHLPSGFLPTNPLLHQSPTLA